ncbi:MAG: DUF2666 family protein [Candidatus Micrarchaeaceae archaeon]
METDNIEFMAKYKNWIAIRKMTITPDTNPEEIAFFISGVRQSIDRKVFEFLDLDIPSLDSYAEKLSGTVKKNPNGFSEVLLKFSTPETKAIISKASEKNPKHENFARIYLMRKVAQLLKLDFDVSQEALSKIYPKLKPPKPRGRLSKS